MPPRACDHCGQQEGEGVVLKRCAQCRQALFCSRECQRAAWPQHKQSCGRVLVGAPGGLSLPVAEAAAPAADAPEPAPGEWRFGRPMEPPRLDLPYPLTREGFEAALPQLLKQVQFTYNVVLTCQGRRSAECSPRHGVFLYSVRKGEPVPGGQSGEIAAQDETRSAMAMLAAMAEPEGGQEKERMASKGMQRCIDMYRAQAALYVMETRSRRADESGVWRVVFEGAVCVALCPGVRRVFKLDMTAGGRRDGMLVRTEAAVEDTSGNLGGVFISRHPRFYPPPR